MFVLNCLNCLTDNHVLLSLFVTIWNGLLRFAHVHNCHVDLCIDSLLFIWSSVMKVSYLRIRLLHVHHFRHFEYLVFLFYCSFGGSCRICSVWRVSL